MAYNKKDLERQSLEAIQKNNLMFVTDIPSYLPCSTSTFYAKKLEQSESIKDALEGNRIKIKNGLRAKWYKSENASVQIALYKIIGTDEEAHRLNGSRQRIDHTTGGEKLPNEFKIDIVGGRKEPITTEDDIDDIG